VERANLVTGALYAKLDKSTTVDLAAFERVAAAPSFLINYISQVFLHSSMSADLQQAVTDALNAAAQASAGNAEAQAQAALYVVLTSGEYSIIQ
jgi:nitrogen fixation/metabolism regulation signal transduction histidine kinase